MWFQCGKIYYPTPSFYLTLTFQLNRSCNWDSDHLACIDRDRLPNKETSMCIFRKNRTSDCVTFCLLTSQIIIFRVEKVNSGLGMDKKRKWKKRKSLYQRNEKYQLVSSQLATRNEFRDKFLSRINIRTTRDHFISYTLFTTTRNHKTIWISCWQLFASMELL